MAIHDPLHSPFIATHELDPNPDIALQAIPVEGQEVADNEELFHDQLAEQTSVEETAPGSTAIELGPADLDRVVDERGRFSRLFSKYKARLAIGAAAVSTTATLALDPLGDTKNAVFDAAPWVAGGVATSEAAFIGGAAMMLAAVGSKVPLNPLKIKEKIPAMARKANDSKLFMSGFIINTAGAVGDFAVLSAGVMKELPVHTWGVLSLTLMDLGVTVAVRKAVLNGAHRHASQELLEPATLPQAQN